MIVLMKRLHTLILKALEKKIEKNKTTSQSFEIRVLGTYYAVRVGQGRDFILKPRF